MSKGSKLHAACCMVSKVLQKCSKEIKRPIKTFVSSVKGVESPSRFTVLILIQSIRIRAEFEFIVIVLRAN